MTILGVSKLLNHSQELSIKNCIVRFETLNSVSILFGKESVGYIIFTFLEVMEDRTHADEMRQCERIQLRDLVNIIMG